MPDPVDLAGTAKDVKKKLFNEDAKGGYLRRNFWGVI
jgi:hypothetical protein